MNSRGIPVLWMMNVLQMINNRQSEGHRYGIGWLKHYHICCNCNNEKKVTWLTCDFNQTVIVMFHNIALTFVYVDHEEATFVRIFFRSTSTKRLVSMGFSHEHNRTDSTVTLRDLPRFHQNVPQYCRAFVYPSGSICRN